MSKVDSLKMPPDGTADGPKWQIKLVGAGVMGQGIAHTVAAVGLSVILLDLTEEILRYAVDKISATIRGQMLMQAGQRANSTQMLSRITLSTDTRALSACNIVIESVTETMEVKRPVYQELGQVIRPDAILAANSSTFPLSERAGFTEHPAQRLIGMHFMNPAQMKRFVEVIVGTETALQTVDASLEFLAAIGKTGILVKDAAGFVSNHVLMLTINEAVRTVEAGTADVDVVDCIFRSCFGHPMGPLATADLIGLDMVLLSLESLQARFRDRKFEPAALLKRMVENRYLGRKTGRGFFDYSAQ